MAGSLKRSGTGRICSESSECWSTYTSTITDRVYDLSNRNLRPDAHKFNTGKQKVAHNDSSLESSRERPRVLKKVLPKGKQPAVAIHGPESAATNHLQRAQYVATPHHTGSTSNGWTPSFQTSKGDWNGRLPVKQPPPDRKLPPIPLKNPNFSLVPWKRLPSGFEDLAVSSSSPSVPPACSSTTKYKDSDVREIVCSSTRTPAPTTTPKDHLGKNIFNDPTTTLGHYSGGTPTSSIASTINDLQTTSTADL